MPINSRASIRPSTMPGFFAMPPMVTVSVLIEIGRPHPRALPEHARSGQEHGPASLFLVAGLRSSNQ